MRTHVGLVLSAVITMASVGFERAEAFQQPLPDETISGIISTTRTISRNARLTGNVSCTVSGAPCIQFGAPGITLDLSDFTISGTTDLSTGCRGDFTAGENGILADSQADITILGPGTVQGFRGNGVFVLNTTRSRIMNVTATTNCLSGIQLQNSTDSHMEANIAVRNGTSALPCGGL